jgi:hypothetical protein
MNYSNWRNLYYGDMKLSADNEFGAGHVRCEDKHYFEHQIITDNGGAVVITVISFPTGIPIKM